MWSVTGPVDTPKRSLGSVRAYTRCRPKPDWTATHGTNDEARDGAPRSNVERDLAPAGFHQRVAHVLLGTRQRGPSPARAMDNRDRLRRRRPDRLRVVRHLPRAGAEPLPITGELTVRRVHRGVVLTGGGSAKAIARGIVYDRKAKKGRMHGGLVPRMGAQDLWDVSCWCGWSSTGHELSSLAGSAATKHRERLQKEDDRAKLPGRARQIVKPPGPTVLRLRKSGSPAPKAKPQKPDPITPSTGDSAGRPAGRHAELRFRGRIIAIDRRENGWAVRCQTCRWTRAAEDRSSAESIARRHFGECKSATKRKVKRRKPR